MTGHMDAHLLTTAIFSPGSLDENDNSLSGTRLREGSKKERFSLLNDILYFLKETMELDEALKFCPDLEEIGFENAEGVIRRLLRLAVAMRQDDEKAKKDKNPDMDAFVKKTLKKIYKDHTSSNKKEEPAEEKETEAELDDPRKDIPGSIHHDLTGEHSDNQEELDEFLGEQPDAEGEHEEGYHSSEKAEELEESFSKYLDKSNKDQWLVEAINKMFDEDTETPKRLAKVRLLREAAQRKNALKEESYVDKLYDDRSEYEQDLKQNLVNNEAQDFGMMEGFKSQRDYDKFQQSLNDIKEALQDTTITPEEAIDALVIELHYGYEKAIELVDEWGKGKFVPYSQWSKIRVDESYMGDLAIERMEQEEKDFDDWTEHDPEEIKWNREHNSFDEAANLKETTPPYLFKDKDGNPVSIGDSFTYLARVNPPLEYTATIEKIKNRIYIVFDDGRKMLFKDFFYGPVDRPYSKKIQKINKEEIDPEDKKQLDFNESKRYPYLFRDKDGNPVSIGDSFTYLARVNPPLEYTATIEKIKNRIYIVFDDGRKMLFKDFFYGPTDRPHSKKIQKINKEEIDPEDAEWLKDHESFDEATSKAAYPGAHDLAKFLCEKFGKKYAWIDPATTGYRVKLWDLEHDEDGETTVKKLQKKLDSLGYPEIKAKLAGVGKRTLAFIVPYTSKIKGKKVKESYLDGTMSGPSDMKSSSINQNSNMPQDDNDVVLQAAAEVLKDKPQNELQDFLASLEK